MPRKDDDGSLAWRHSVTKAAAMIPLGLLLGLVGTDSNTGGTGFTFGLNILADGIDFAIVAIGVFGVGDIITSLARSDRSGDPMIFLDRPISLASLVFTCLLFAMVALPIIRTRREEAIREG